MLSLRTTTLGSAAAFVDIWPQIESLRRSSLAKGDVLLDPLHYLAQTNQGERSCCSVACWDGNQLVGILYATQHLAWGIRTGYAIGGDCSGRGLVLCRPEHESAVIKAAAERMFADGIHSLHLRIAPRFSEQPDFPKLRAKHLDALIPGDLMSLGSSYEEFLTTLGKHTRRNVRAYTRKTVDAGISFDPWIDDETFRRERRRLNGVTRFAMKQSHMDEDDRLLALHNEGQRMGLRGADGNLVSLVCGFARGSRFHVLTQWNDALLEKLSLSLVLRGYAVEHLISRGFSELQFMGGSSLGFGQFCPPHQYSCLSLDRKHSVTAAAKRLIAGYCLSRVRAGKPVSSTLKTLSGGFLDDALLGERTTIIPSPPLPSSQRDSEPTTSSARKSGLIRSSRQLEACGLECVGSAQCQPERHGY